MKRFWSLDPIVVLGYREISVCLLGAWISFILTFLFRLVLSPKVV